MTPHPTARHTSWAHTPERSNMLMLRVMTWISLRLGRRAARGVLHLIAAYFLLFSPASRRASSNFWLATRRSSSARATGLRMTSRRTLRPQRLKM